MKAIKIFLFSVVGMVVATLYLSCNRGQQWPVRFDSVTRMGNYETYDHANRYKSGNTVIDCPVKNIEVDWFCGNVTLIPGEDDGVEVSELCSVQLDKDHSLHYYLAPDGTLKIQCYASGLRFDNHTAADTARKNLMVRIPRGMKIDKVEVDVTSGDINISCDCGEADLETVSGDVHTFGITCSNLKAESTSGDIGLTTVTCVGEVEVEAVSGDIYCENVRCASLEAECTSGDVSAVFDQLPPSVELSSTCGDVNLCVPKDAGLTAEANCTVGDVHCNLSAIVDGDTYTIGNGASKVILSAVSGDIHIR